MKISTIEWAKCPHCGFLLNSWNAYPSRILVEGASDVFSETTCANKKCGKTIAVSAKVALTFKAISSHTEPVPKPLIVPRISRLKNVPKGLSLHGRFNCACCGKTVFEADFSKELTRRAKMGHMLGFCSDDCKTREWALFDRMKMRNFLAFD